MRDWILAMRPKHWLKNAFVFAPVIFSEHVQDGTFLKNGLIATWAFCLISSAMYLLNDVIDRKTDAQHPRKRNRPIASGRITPMAALLGVFILAGFAFLLLALTLPPRVLGFAALYIANTLAYAIVLKNKVLLDVMLIAMGFVIRLLAGCAAVAVEPSSWLLVCGFSLALVLGFGKRRAEVGLDDVTASYRATLVSYDEAKLNVLLGTCTAVCLLAYMLFTVSPETVTRHGTANLVYTVPLVAYGLFRYVFKAMERRADGPTDILVGDPVFPLTGFLWIVAVLVVLAWK